MLGRRPRKRDAGGRPVSGSQPARARARARATPMDAARARNQSAPHGRPPPSGRVGPHGGGRGRGVVEAARRKARRAGAASRRLPQLAPFGRAERGPGGRSGLIEFGPGGQGASRASRKEFSGPCAWPLATCASPPSVHSGRPRGLTSKCGPDWTLNGCTPFAKSSERVLTVRPRRSGAGKRAATARASGLTTGASQRDSRSNAAATPTHACTGGARAQAARRPRKRPAGERRRVRSEGGAKETRKCKAVRGRKSARKRHGGERRPWVQHM